MVQRASLYAHEHFVRGNLRLRHVCVFEFVGAAVFAKDNCLQNASMIRFNTNAQRKKMNNPTATNHHSQPSPGFRFSNSRRFQSSYLKSSGSSMPVPS